MRLALPDPLVDHPLLLAERGEWSAARVERTADAVLLVRPGAQGDVLFALGPDAGVLDLLDAEARLRYRSEARGAMWLSAPASVAVPAWVLDALGLAAFSRWDWLATTERPRERGHDAGTVRLLDRLADQDAIRAVLTAANPISTADPSAAGEVAWFGAYDGEALVGVIGARIAQGGLGEDERGGRGADRVGSAWGTASGTAPDSVSHEASAEEPTVEPTDGEPFSWHLHGLAVLPQTRRRGLGAALTAAATAAGLDAGADWVSLGMYADNAGARRLYERLGFVTQARMASYGPQGVTRPLR